MVPAPLAIIASFVGGRGDREAAQEVTSQPRRLPARAIHIGPGPALRWAAPIPAGCDRFAREMQITVDFDRSFTPEDANAQ